MYDENDTYLLALTTVALPTVEITDVINMFVAGLACDKTTCVHGAFQPIVADSIAANGNLPLHLLSNPVSLPRPRLCPSSLA